jgi:hypothetical protein
VILAGGALNCNHCKESATGKGPHGRSREACRRERLSGVAACCSHVAVGPSCCRAEKRDEIPQSHLLPRPDPILRQEPCHTAVACVAHHGKSWPAMAESGQSETPIVATATEELASIPDKRRVLPRNLPPRPATVIFGVGQERTPRHLRARKKVSPRVPLRGVGPGREKSHFTLLADTAQSHHCAPQHREQTLYIRW